MEHAAFDPGQARAGTFADEATGVELHAFDAGTEDLLACHGLLLGTPENFGYMSGALKDFFDRTYYPCEGKLTGLPYAIFVSAGNDGSGAVREIGRIANGYGWKAVADALIERLPDHEFAIARQLVADATISAVDHRFGAMERLEVTAVLLLEEG